MGCLNVIIERVSGNISVSVRNVSDFIVSISPICGTDLDHTLVWLCDSDGVALYSQEGRRLIAKNI